MNAGASTYAVPSPIKGSGTAWVLLGSWALSPARPTPIHPRHECRGFSALLVSPTQERAILGYLATTRYPSRDRVMFLLSMKAGLRAKEMASLTWAMVTDADGQVAEVLHVPNRDSKAKTLSGQSPSRSW